MGLTMEQQKVVASQMARRYRQASEKKKGQIIGVDPLSWTHRE